MTTMFTGNWFWTEASETAPSLFAQLHARGFHTVVVGYASGPNQYVKNETVKNSVDVVVERPIENEAPHASSITDGLLSKLEHIGERPFFAWGHYLDPHFPYAGEGTRRARYQSDVDATASEVARLIEELRRRNLLERSVVIVTADHGEEFHEHGNGYHNLTLYEEVLKVPLYVRYPGASRRGTLAEPTSAFDLTPALVAAASKEAEAIPPEQRLARPVFAFTAVVPEASPPVGVGAVVHGRYKLIYELRLRSAELYDLQSDPTEQSNIVDRRPDVAARLAAELVGELESTGMKVD